jgi:hypothetical protein
MAIRFFPLLTFSQAQQPTHARTRARTQGRSGARLAFAHAFFIVCFACSQPPFSTPMVFSGLKLRGRGPWWLVVSSVPGVGFYGSVSGRAVACNTRTVCAQRFGDVRSWSGTAVRAWQPQAQAPRVKSVPKLNTPVFVCTRCHEEECTCACYYVRTNNVYAAATVAHGAVNSSKCAFASS